jgi:hypothetical protein
VGGAAGRGEAPPPALGDQTPHRWEDRSPEGGLVLSMITRDLPADCDPLKPCAARWKQDRVWFSKGEARQWLPREPKVGDKHPVPPELVSRLARLYLVDTVNGQTSPLRPGKVPGSQIATEVLERTGGRVKVKVTGTTKGDAPEQDRRASARGVETRILEHAMHDLDNGSVRRIPGGGPRDAVGSHGAERPSPGSRVGSARLRVRAGAGRRAAGRPCGR